LPFQIREVSEPVKSAKLTASEGDPEPIRNGIDRPIGDNNNCWTGKIGSWVEWTFGFTQLLTEIRFVFDSDLNRRPLNMPCNYLLNAEPVSVPKSMVKAFRIEVVDFNGNWNVVAEEYNNYQRLVRIKTEIEAIALRFTPLATWGSEDVNLFAWDVR